jgi:poly(3-hydroxybutyrate) depolymerase
VVASFSTTTAAGTSTGNRVWYTGDFEMADIILACAVQQGLVDARQIFTAGCSAGGLQAGAMIYGRSSYLAASMPNSGGIVGRPQLQDPEHVPAVITTHGGPNDFVIISFAESSAALDQDIREKGGFVVNCDHGGDHCQSPPEVVAAQWAFLKAHPYGVAPEPYEAGLPAGFPAACQIVQ